MSILLPHEIIPLSQLVLSSKIWIYKFNYFKEKFFFLAQFNTLFF